MDGGAVGDADAGGDLVGDPRRDRDHGRGRDCDLFSCAAISDIGGDPVTRLEARHTAADAFDDAGYLARGRERQFGLRLVFSPCNQRVEEVQRRGFDLDDDLVRAGGRLGNVAYDDTLRAIEALAKRGFHM